MAVLSVAATRISGVNSRVGCTYSKARCEKILPCHNWLAPGQSTQLQGVLITSAGTRRSCHVPSMGDPLLRVCGELMATAGRRKGRGSALACSCSVDLASNMFTFGTAMVVPFYTLMLAAPKWRGTRKVMDSAIPYVILGAMYMYLLSISWTPEHPKLMFSSKYWLPELSGITRMFSSMLTVSSAWIHLLAVDLFAGRNIYLDSITHNLPSRHSLVLCLMFGPVGIFSHLFTKNIVMAWRKATKTEKDNRASEAGPINVFPNEPFAGSGHHEPTVDGVRPSKARGT
ncbi:abscisic acid -deficient 4 protein [Klebsormidium nitens]|uniref:Abscisic acid-deficient 4 protein n=1 Tax=Klebsormidium nitens TaxID=105231 RepID=A0A1Y1I5H4_KLENI|nr:abscisic acid -deficient 4 protein [Klebsormidium nitens]|eukprot:GAQ84411.1 abscisic acid -deficient 4 protein [Klebsormidium nitens]